MYALFCSAYSVSLEGSRVAFKQPPDYVPWRSSIVWRRILSLLVRKIQEGPLPPESCEPDRRDFPFGKIGSKLDMFHEQLPLPVPCSVFPSYRYEAWTISSSVLQTAFASSGAMTQQCAQSLRAMLHLRNSANS